MPLWDDPRTVEQRVGALDGGVVISPLSNFTLTVELDFAEDRPHVDLDRWDQVGESGLRAPSGRLVVMGPTDSLDEAPRLIGAPAEYAALVLFGGLQQELREDRGCDHHQCLCGPANPSQPGCSRSSRSTPERR